MDQEKNKPNPETLRETVPSSQPQKTNIWMIVSIILLTAIIAGGAVYFFLNSTKKTPPVKISPVTESPSPSPQITEQVPLKKAEITSIDNLWNKYTNPLLGFSLKTPKTMIEPYGQCNYSSVNGDHSYRPKEGAVPVKIFEEGDKVYIAAEFTYQLTGETKENGRNYFSGCDKITNTTVRIADRQNYYSPSWIIEVKDVRNDNELTAFLKNRYGSGCNLGEKKVTSQEGVFDIKIQGDGKDLSETKCPLNYMTEVRYYPNKNKVAAWDIGQACNFYYPTIETCIETEMVNSFKFE